MIALHTTIIETGDIFSVFSDISDEERCETEILDSDVTTTV
jgi:hypothetical protein